MNLKELAENIGLDEDEFRELLDLFIEAGTSDYDRLKTAFDAGDAQGVARSAHTLNGAAGNLGIMNIHEVAKKIERAAGDDRLDAVSDDVILLKTLFDEVEASVRA